jgi:hypothetical protein
LKREREEKRREEEEEMGSLAKIRLNFEKFKVWVQVVVMIG